MYSAILTAALLGTAAVSGQEASTQGLSLDDLFYKDVKQSELSDNLKNLYEIALANGGNRAFGFPGFDASVDFVLKRIGESNRWPLQGFKVWKQPFTGLFTQITKHTLNISNTESYAPAPLNYAPSTPAEGYQAEIAIVPGDAKPCSPEELLATGADVKGKILLIERGSCPDGTTFAGKVKTASGAGAIAALIYNNVDPPINIGTLSAPNPQYIPSGILQRAEGLSIRNRILAGETFVAKYTHIQILENRTTTNVFAETKAGDPNNVVMLGAHLDGVQAGAGINDDGSGSSLILELLRTINPFTVRNKVRFAWWGAEENGLLGSKHYVETLPAKDVSNLLTYLNFDMVGRGFYGVFDGDGSTYGLVAPPGSDVIEKLFVDFFTKRNIAVTPAALSGGSDYVHFLRDINKPVGGLFTGTGFEQDPCYHQACDTFDNVNKTQLYINTLAAQSVLKKLVKDGHKIIPKGSNNATSAARLAKIDVEWTSVDDGHSHSGCKGEI